MTNFAVWRDIRNIVCGFVCGAALCLKVVLTCFEHIWANAAPATPRPEQGLVYLNKTFHTPLYYSAFQDSTLSLFYPAGFVAILSILFIPKKNIKFKFMKIEWDEDDPNNLHGKYMLIGASITLIIACFFGHQIIETLISWGLRPPDDT